MISSFVYRRILDGNPLTARLWKLIRRLIIKLNTDATCVMCVHGRDLKMPMSHSLPLNMKDNPFYDQLPSRLAKFIKIKLKSVKFLDVGANIGDSIAALKQLIRNENNESKDIFIAIEPNPSFRKYLNVNWKGDQSVTILD